MSVLSFLAQAAPGRAPIPVTEQEPLGIEDVIGLPSTAALESAVVSRQLAVDAAMQGLSQRRRDAALSDLRRAERDLRFGRWRDRYLADHRPAGCQPWCLGRGYRRTSETVHDESVGATYAVGVEYCPCEDGAAAQARHEARARANAEEAAQREAARVWDDIGIPPKLRRYTLDSYLALHDADAALVAKLRRWLACPTAWLLLHGEAGTCKTGLSIALLEERRRAGDSALYVVTPDFLDRIRLTYRQKGEDDADATDVLASAASVGLLLLDDVGKTPLSEWGRSQLFTLVNRRDAHERRTIVTTNLSLDQLEAHVDSPTFDRIRGNACDAATGESFVIEMAGESRRGLPS